MLTYDVLYDLAGDTCERYGSVVLCKMDIAFFVGIKPVVGELS